MRGSQIHVLFNAASGQPHGLKPHDMDGDDDQSMANEFGDLGDLCDEIANEGSLNSSPSSPSQTVPVPHVEGNNAAPHPTKLWSWLDFQRQLIESGADPSLATQAWVANHFRFVHAVLLSDETLTCCGQDLNNFCLRTCS